MPDDCVKFAIKDLVWMQEESYCSRIWFFDDQSWPDHIQEILWPGLEKEFRPPYCHAYAQSYNMLSIIYCGSYL